MKPFLPSVHGTLFYYMISWIQRQCASWPWPWLLPYSHIYPFPQCHCTLFCHPQIETFDMKWVLLTPMNTKNILRVVVMEDLITVSGKGDLQGVVCIHGARLSMLEDT